MRLNKNINVSQTFIIGGESESSLSACTSLFTNNIEACSGDTITIYDNLSGSTLYFNSYYSGNTNLLDLINNNDTFITGGTYSNGIATFTNNNNDEFNVNGFFNQNLFAEHTGNTQIHFTKSDILLSEIGNSGHTHTISEIDNLQYNLNNKFDISGGTIFGSLSSTTISASTFYGDGYNLKNIRRINEDILITTGNSQSTISTIILNELNKNRFIEVFITASLDDNNYGFWKRTLAITNISGFNSISFINFDIDKYSNGLNPYSVNFLIDSNNLLINISGETSKTYNWTCDWSIIKE